MRSHIPLLSAVLLVTPALADPLADTVREAVAAHKLRDSDLKGSGAALTPYREVAADAGVLVGLEVGLGGSPPVERIAAVRPVYRVAGKNRPGTSAGRFLSDEVTRTVRLVARDGYAVGGLRVSAGRRVDGLAVCFLRVDGSGLNPADAYESNWVGNMKAEARELVDGQGQPVVGLFGRLEGDILLGLGLTFADVPVASAALAAPPTVSTRTAQTEIPVDEPDSSGNTVLAIVAFAAVAVPLALVGFFAVRRRPIGIQQLPRAIKSLTTIDLKLTRPPSIPTDLLMPTAKAPPAARPDVDRLIAMETDAFRD